MWRSPTYDCVVSDVRRLVPADVTGISEVLARAFYDDPAVEYVFPNSRTRHKTLRRFFAFQLRHTFIPRGECYTTEGLHGGCLWMPPNPVGPGMRELLQLVPLVAILKTRLPATLRMLTLMEAHHPRTPHYYLGSIGTDPPWQGKGIGSAIMQPVLERCDEEGMPAYLESSKERNIPFYMRHGFEVSAELRSEDGGLVLWSMWREPVLGR